MTLPSRHRIRNLNPGGLRPSSLLLGHGGSPQYIESLRVSREETYGFFETEMPERGTNPRTPTFQADSFNHCTRAPASSLYILVNARCHYLSVLVEVFPGSCISQTCLWLTTAPAPPVGIHHITHSFNLMPTVDWMTIDQNEAYSVD